MKREIGEIQKNSRETIRVQFVEFNGMDLLDVRVWASNKLGDSVPTKKGLSINPEILPELLELLQRAAK